MKIFLFLLSIFIFSAASLFIGLSNPIHSLLLLIFIFFLGSILLFFLQIEYFALLFFIVYVGAIVVLFLFVVMLLEIRIVNLAQRFSNLFLYRIWILIFFLVELLFFFCYNICDLFFVLLQIEQRKNLFAFHEINLEIDYSTLIKKTEHLHGFGIVLFTEYKLAIIFAALLLLISMIGSIVMTLYINTIKILKVQNQLLQAGREKHLLLMSYTFLMGFVSPFSTAMEGIVRFHDDLFIFLVFISMFVFYLLFICISTFKDSNKSFSQNIGKVQTKLVQKFVHASTLEILWTVIPGLLLLFIAIPSFSLLYSLDENFETFMIFKILGNQWFWQYTLLEIDNLHPYFNMDLSKEKGVFNNFIFSQDTYDSYMILENELYFRTDLFSKFRLLTVDNPLYVPKEITVKLLVSSTDVLHSWAVPALGIKMDACPGRLNQGVVSIMNLSRVYGQCSEICGLNHAFMPISLIGK